MIFYPYTLGLSYLLTDIRSGGDGKKGFEN